MFGALAERRHMDWEDVESIEQVLAKCFVGDPLLEIPVRGRYDPDVHANGFRAAKPLIRRSSEHAQQLDLDVCRQVTDLVEEDGRAIGELNRPICRASAPVKAPFSRPNSSLSRSVVGMAEQLTRTISCRHRALNSCKWVASNSLPVPVSPYNSTVELVAATWRSCSRTRPSAGLRPTMRPSPNCSGTSRGTCGVVPGS